VCGEPDQRRTCEEPEVAYGRDRGKCGAGLDPAHMSRRAEEHGDDVRDAEADEPTPDHGGGRRAHEERAAEPAGGHRPRCAEQPAGPEQADQAVAAKRPAAMASENAAKPAAATAGVVSSVSRR